MPKPPAFRLNGKTLELKCLPRWAAKIMEFASRLEDDDIVDLREVAKRTGFSHQTVKAHSGFIELDPLRARIQVGQRRMVVFGNPKTIKKLVASLESA